MNTALDKLDADLAKRKNDAHEGYNQTYSSIEKTLCFLRSKWSYLTPIILIAMLSFGAYVRTAWEYKKMQRLREKAVATAAAVRLAHQQKLVEVKNLEKEIYHGEKVTHPKGDIPFKVVWRDIQGISAVPVYARLNEQGDFKLYEPGSVEKPGPLNSLDDNVVIVELKSPNHDIDIYYKTGKRP